MPRTSESAIAAAPGGVRVAVRLTVRARSDRLDGIASLADGSAALKVSVAAPPLDGRANDALIALLAREWGVPRRDLAIVGGPRSRSKIVHVAGEPAALMARIGAVLATLPGS